MTRSIHFLFAFIFAASLILGSPGYADEGDWRIHAGTARFDPDLGLTTSDGSRIEAGKDQGLYLGISHRFHRRWSFALEVGHSAPELSVAFSANGTPIRVADELNNLPITVGFDWHLTPDRRFDLFLGARLAYVYYGDLVLEQDGLGRQEFDADGNVSWGLLAGLDVPFRDSPWSFHAVLGHLDTEVDLVNRQDGAEASLELDPTFLSLGIGYRF